MQNLVPTIILTPASETFSLNKHLGKINNVFFFFFSLATGHKSLLLPSVIQLAQKGQTFAADIVRLSTIFVGISFFFFLMKLW